jgi:hypothetical protein
MRKILLTIVILVITASMASAQGRIGIFGDQAGTQCTVADVPGLVALYVVHINSPGATACEYSAPIPACMQAMWLSDGTVFPVNIGNKDTGISTAYGACRLGNIHVLTINFLGSGTTGQCCVYPVLPHPINGLNITDCVTPFPNKLSAPGQSGVINEVNPTCLCADIIPTHNSTWGGVKALWSNN